ncbi:unnamed protein product [Durusdinium trenchii]|uniref:Uncharacterized protein n=1 Tax=Durusdinium trenchii TaxID=1381693 RepID=A0ABP0K6C7_9DINO
MTATSSSTTTSATATTSTSTSTTSSQSVTSSSTATASTRTSTTSISVTRSSTLTSTATQTSTSTTTQTFSSTSTSFVTVSSTSTASMTATSSSTTTSTSATTSSSTSTTSSQSMTSSSTATASTRTTTRSATTSTTVTPTTSTSISSLTRTITLTTSSSTATSATFTGTTTSLTGSSTSTDSKSSTTTLTTSSSTTTSVTASTSKTSTTTASTTSSTTSATTLTISSSTATSATFTRTSTTTQTVSSSTATFVTSTTSKTTTNTGTSTSSSTISTTSTSSETSTVSSTTPSSTSTTSISTTSLTSTTTVTTSSSTATSATFTGTTTSLTASSTSTHSKSSTTTWTTSSSTATSATISTSKTSETTTSTTSSFTLSATSTTSKTSTITLTASTLTATTSTSTSSSTSSSSSTTSLTSSSSSSTTTSSTSTMERAWCRKLYGGVCVASEACEAENLEHDQCFIPVPDSNNTCGTRVCPSSSLSSGGSCRSCATLVLEDWNQDVVLSGELRWAAFGETEDQENLLEGYHVFAIDDCGQELMLLDSVPVQSGKTSLLDCCSLGWYYSSIEHHVPRETAGLMISSWQEDMGTVLPFLEDAPSTTTSTTLSVTSSSTGSSTSMTASTLSATSTTTPTTTSTMLQALEAQGCLGLSTDNAELFIENPEAAKEVAQKTIADTTGEDLSHVEVTEMLLGGCDGTGARRLQQVQQVSFSFVIRIPIQPAVADLSSARLQAAVQSMEQASVEQVTQIFNERLQEDTTFQGRVTAEVTSMVVDASSIQPLTTQEVILPHSTRQPLISEDPPKEAAFDRMTVLALILAAVLVTFCCAMVTYSQITRKLAVRRAKEMEQMEDSFSRMMGLPDDEPPQPDVLERMPELEWDSMPSVHDEHNPIEVATTRTRLRERAVIMHEHQPIEVAQLQEITEQLVEGCPQSTLEPTEDVDLYAQLDEEHDVTLTLAAQADFMMPEVMDEHTPQTRKAGGCLWEPLPRSSGPLGLAPSCASCGTTARGNAP